MGGYVGLIEAQRVHIRSQAVRRCFKPSVKSRDPLRLAHIEQIDRIDIGILREKVDISVPVFRRPHQTVKQQERPPRARALIVDLNPGNHNETFSNLTTLFSCHCSTASSKREGLTVA